jgi:hypothetical protein
MNFAALIDKCESESYDTKFDASNALQRYFDKLCLFSDLQTEKVGNLKYYY